MNLRRLMWLCATVLFVALIVIGCGKKVPPPPPPPPAPPPPATAPPSPPPPPPQAPIPEEIKAYVKSFPRSAQSRVWRGIIQQNPTGDVEKWREMVAELPRDDEEEE